MTLPVSNKADEYFLSESNPSATADQLWVERKVLRLLQRDDVRAAIAKATFLWRVVSENSSEQAMALLEDAIYEFGVNYCIKAANSDVNHPRVAQNWMLAHEWFDIAIPAARIGGDNPDNCYRLIPIEHGAAYRVDGQMYGDGPADLIWSIVANAGTSMVQTNLVGRDMAVDADGHFSITIDADPANGRPNHMQTERGALFLFVRDSIGDWDAERPNRIRVTRQTPPSAPPIDEDEMAWRAIDWMVRDVPLYHWFTLLNKNKPANQLIEPESSGGVGGVASQYATYGNLRIADDEAYIIRLNHGGAAFRNMVAQDWWFRTIAPDRFTSSLNNAQMAADADGNYTFVVSHRDPGVHNWIDTRGLRETILLHRWQNVTDDTPEAELPKLFNQDIVKFAALKDYIGGAKTISPDERKHQIAARQAQYRVRLSP